MGFGELKNCFRPKLTFLGMTKACQSAFSTPHVGISDTPKSPSLLGICPASDTQFSPLPFPCFLPLHPADSVWHSSWVLYLVGCFSFSLHLVFTSLGSRVFQLCSLQPSLSCPPKSTYPGLLGVLTQPSLIFLFLFLQYLDLDRQSSLESLGGLWSVVGGHLWSGE